MAPSSQRVSHLEELDKHQDDATVLGQGRKFQDRVFLPSSKDRKLLKKLVTEETRADDFIESKIESENDQLVKKVIEVYDDVPDEYIGFLTDIGKVELQSAL